MISQELVELRKNGWRGLPPPPTFTPGKPKPTDANQKEPAAFLGLLNGELEPPPLPLESFNPETDTTPPSPVTRSPSSSSITLSDFTIADPSDDEFPIDPTVVVPHETFYLEDGNVEVLCKRTLFRVHATAMSFHSPTLRWMFGQTNLAMADSPNGRPRLLSSDAPEDFATLLKVLYLPKFVATPAYR